MIEPELKERWDKKKQAIYNLQANINRLKRKINNDLCGINEKDMLTALIIRIMMRTSERVGNEGSALEGHFGVTWFKPKHVRVQGNTVHLDYIGKSGVEHEKCFFDETSATYMRILIRRNNRYLFTTSDGFRITADRVNRYLRRFNAKSKDIRGFNANRMVVSRLRSMGKVEEKKRAKVFNAVLREVAKKIGHGAATLRKHYLLPSVEETFYKYGSVGKLRIE